MGGMEAVERATMKSKNGRVSQIVVDQKRRCRTQTARRCWGWRDESQRKWLGILAYHRRRLVRDLVTRLSGNLPPIWAGSRKQSWLIVLAIRVKLTARAW